MSTILNALKKSEELRNRKIPTQSLASNHYQYPVAEETNQAIWPYVTIAVLSTSLLCGGLFWYLSANNGSTEVVMTPELELQQILARSQSQLPVVPESQIVELDFAKQQPLAPNTSLAAKPSAAPVAKVQTEQQGVQQTVQQPLQQTAGHADVEFLPEKQFDTVPLPVYVSSQRPTSRLEQIKPQAVAPVDPLADLDLSDTSPELAAKIRLALGGEQEQVEAEPQSPDEIDYSDVSDTVAAKFQRALAAQEAAPVAPPAPSQPMSAIPVSNLPDDIQGKIPPFAYNSHVYSSLVEKRSVRFNGTEFKEGDSVFTPDLTLLEIRPDYVIMRYQNQSFSVKSMEDWKGY
ncbi:general secretion pathway protein GspB [Motilimonas sp. KMU-193]|uniref:general secretion pathway protein GspB n=1 Tax=Motilimonas sp. KMU-193 TaxID=3388668 RepID=UPI00396B2DA3